MVAAFAATTVALTLYVSPTGNDAATGRTPDQALASPARALELSRARAPGTSATIELTPGVYRVAQTLELGPQDSGLTLRGAGTNLPRLIGGRVVEGWQPAGLSHREILKTNVGTANLGELRRRGFAMDTQVAGLELFVDGEPMRLAEYPNRPDWLRITSVPEPNVIQVPERLEAPDLWVLGYWTFDWAESYERVLGVDGDRLRLSGAGTYGAQPGRRFRYLNVLSALDSPGEWFLDRATGDLYLWPLAGTPKEAIVSELETPLIVVRGARDVTVEGMALEAGRGSGVQVLDSSHVTLRGCLVRNFGTMGVEVRGGKQVQVVGCDLTGMGDGAVVLAGGDRLSLEPSGHVASDNRIWAYSRWRRTYCAGIDVSGVGQVVRRNLISDAPHNGILLSGNDHLIEGNDFARLCTETGDAGAVYMGRNPTMRGTRILRNRFREMQPGVNTEGNFTEVMAVYLDDCWGGTTIAGNLFDVRGTAIMLGGGQDNAVLDNTFVDAHPAISFDARAKGWAKTHFEGGWEWQRLWKEVPAEGPLYIKRYPGLEGYWSKDPAWPSGCTISRNRVYGGQWLRLLDGLTEKDFANEGNELLDGKPAAETRRFGPRPGPRPLARVGSA